MGHLHHLIKEINNQTRYCPEEIDQYISNLTSSYIDQRNEPTMVSASVIMFVLAGLFFNLNLFSGISDISATLDPRVRLFLTSALSLFLPVMSYLFSEAKNATRHSSTVSSGDLPLMAGLILTWMLLVELLRKKVDEIRMRGYSGTIQRAGRVIWLGNLVFFNIKTTGRKAVFSILWILCATRVVQRIAFTELGKRSYAHGRNARVISSYMAQMLGALQHGDVEQAVHQQEDDGTEVLIRRCKYIVMGEEKLVEEATADGYRLATTAPDDGSVVSVGKVWELAETDKLFTSSDQSKGLKRLCLSFALSKLLRRRFEHMPEVTEKEARDCRDLIFKGGGLFRSDDGGESAEAVIQVVNDEVNFLCEYYHSVVPVALASPFFLVVNYFLVLVVVALLCLMAVIVCGNGDASYAFRSIGDDNYVLQFGIGKLAVCVISKAVRSHSAFFCTVDLAITALLFVIYLYEEIWEFFVFLLSNWFMVSLLASYASKPRWRQSAAFRLAFRCLVRMRGMLSHPDLSFRQFSALNLRWPLRLPFVPALALGLRKELVPKDVKQCIVRYLVQRDQAAGTDATLSNGGNALRRNRLERSLSWACSSDSVAEVILTWHIATSILEAEHEAQSQMDAEAALRRVAVSLSKYCAYLVAFHPELLPDNPEKAEAVVDGMKAELGRLLGRLGYYLYPLSARVKKIMNLQEKTTTTASGDQQQQGTAAGVVRNGARLGRMLMAQRGPEAVWAWKVLADVWTELTVFVAPSSEEERIKGHEDVLVQGGEFVTVLWALATHTGVSRPPNKPTNTCALGRQRTLEDLFGDSMRAPCPASN